MSGHFTNQFEELGYFSDQIKTIEKSGLSKEDKVGMLETLLNKAADPLAHKMVKEAFTRVCNGKKM